MRGVSRPGGQGINPWNLRNVNIFNRVPTAKTGDQTEFYVLKFFVSFDPYFTLARKNGKKYGRRWVKTWKNLLENVGITQEVGDLVMWLAMDRARICQEKTLKKNNWFKSSSPEPTLESVWIQECRWKISFCNSSLGSQA